MQAVQNIVAETEDLTVLYYVGAQKRTEANQQGITRWRDPSLTPAAVGIGCEKMVPRFQALLDINRESGGPALRPGDVAAAREMEASPVCTRQPWNETHVRNELTTRPRPSPL